MSSTWFFATATMYGHGRDVENYPFDCGRFGPLIVVVGVMWLWSLNLIRISGGLMPLRLKDDRRWFWPLRALIALQGCLMLAVMGMQIFTCNPISALWNPTPESQCIPVSGMRVYIIVYNGESANQHQPMKRCYYAKFNLYISLSLQRHQRPSRLHDASYLHPQDEPHFC